MHSAAKGVDQPALALEGVSHSYGEVLAASDVTLDLRPGEVVCLLGPSGCGKTTILRLAAGLERLQQGSVRIDGQLVAGAGADMPPEARGVGLMFQDFALFPHLSVADNVAFGLRRLGAGALRERVAQVLARVGMERYLEAYPHMLSGGQQQRVALARALAPEPKVMLLDEPFSGLDYRLRNKIRDDTLHLLMESGAATLLVTHDPEEAMFMADRIALMCDGRIEQLGRPVDLYCAPENAFVASFFGDINRFNGVVQTGSVQTPFGMVAASGLPDGSPVEVLIRPEALRLAPPGAGGAGEEICLARVMASHMLGRTSLVHLSPQEATGPLSHWHARVPGRFLPEENEVLQVSLDRSQTFVFPLESIN
ncbi:MAG TPA: ABC transporter ATP-binding protein [Kiloniellaceae bacterium]|nr:ABC transporter ATP-binding protein [Kiloniellaceae bacterium]